MKHSIVILDDEPLIVAALSETIDWAGLNCEVAGTAYNGIDGLAMIDRMDPDIVISDIVMPGKTGLELAEWCFKKHPETQLIFLSAHSDFEYAQRAIQYGVRDYVLKPIDPEKLMEAVKRAAVKLDSLEQERRRFSSLENAVKTAEPIISSSILFDIARYGVNMLRNEYRDLINGLVIDAGVVICVRLYNLPMRADAAFMPEMQKKYAEQFNEDGFTLIRGSADDKMLFLCLLPKGIDFQTGEKRVMESAFKAGEKITGDKDIVCVSVISRHYRNPDELHKRYLEGLDMLPISFFSEKTDVLHVGELPAAPAANEIQNPESLLHHLANGNLDLLREELDALCGGLDRLRDRELAIHTLRELHRKAANIASKAGMIHKPQEESDAVQPNFTLMSRDIADYLFSICSYIQMGKNTLSKLKLIVDENYSSPGFGLSAAAEKMRISSSYLSRLFKKETGENFLDYLINIRIERSKYLLETTSLHNHEIAAQVGFDSDHYFGQVFKKKCGITPKEYRKKYHI